MSKRLSKLQRSNNAHWRLKQVAADVPGKRGEVLYAYHSEVLKRQSSRRYVISRAERRKLFLNLKSKYR